MKNLILFTAAILFSVHNYAQTYHPLPDSNAKWCIEYNNHVIPPPFWWYTNYWETYYSGDTIIDNREYKKMERTEYDIFCLNTVVNGPDYMGAIREDAINKKVFYTPPGQSNEELIYDFNLEPGDTLISYLNWNEPLIVDFIDSLLINNDYHKRIVFKYGEAEIIEGIGSSTGILEELVAFEGGSHLCALYIDTTLIYPEYPCNLSATDTCSTLTTETQIKKSEISIYPNPAKDQLKIEISIELLLKKPFLKIFTSNGSICCTQTLTNEITKIDLNDFAAGIYLVHVSTESNIVSNEKIIIEQ